MAEFFKFKRLKIVEQIGIVLFFAVLIPMTISGFIINNINQQSVRSQLRESAVLIANMVSDEEIWKIAETSSDLREMGMRLVSLANENGGKDNIAVVLVQPDTKEVEVC